MRLRFALCVNFGLVACVANAQPSVTFPLNDASRGVTGAVQGAVFRLGAWGLLGPLVKSFYPFDAGPAVNFRTPQGLMSAPQKAAGLYHTAPYPFLPLPAAGPGKYSLDNGSGGVDSGPFQAVFHVPPTDFTVTGLDLSEGYLVNWRGGGQEGGYVIMRGVY